MAGRDWPHEAEQSIRQGLWPGERLLWLGHAAPGRLFVQGDGCRIPFMLAWTGFAVFWTAAALAGGAGPAALFGCGFIAIGTWVLIGPILQRRRLPGTTAYAITSRRAIVRDIKGTSSEVPIEQVNPVINRSKDGRLVTVQLAPAQGMAATSNSFTAIASATARMGPSFIDVENGDLMLAALDRARGGAYQGPGAGFDPPPPPPPPWPPRPSDERW